MRPAAIPSQTLSRVGGPLRRAYVLPELRGQPAPVGRAEQFGPSSSASEVLKYEGVDEDQGGLKVWRTIAMAYDRQLAENSPSTVNQLCRFAN